MSDDPHEQLRAARHLLAASTPRLKRAAAKLEAAQSEFNACHQQVESLNQLVRYWEAEAAKSLFEAKNPAWESKGWRPTVEAAMRQIGRPAKIGEIHAAAQALVPDVSYYSIRTVLDRGWKRGRYARIGMRYALPTPDEQADTED